MTNEQLYLAIGVPVVLNIVSNGFMFVLLNSRIAQMEGFLKDIWRADVRRFEDALDARPG